MGRGKNLGCEMNILDELKYKFVGECIGMPTKITQLKENYYNEYMRNFLDPMERVIKDRSNRLFNQRIDEEIKAYKVQTAFDEVYYDYEGVDRLKARKIRVSKYPIDPPAFMESPDNMTDDDYFEYYDIERYNRCIMFNISPNWKGDLNIKKRDHLAKTLLEFCGLQYFSRYSFAIECGGDGDFIHAHAVLELNPQALASATTWIKKGNHNRSFRKLWDKAEGFRGLVKGRHSLQTMYLNASNIRDDKLNYLIEDRKPADHKNKPHPEYPFLCAEW